MTAFNSDIEAICMAFGEIDARDVARDFDTLDYEIRRVWGLYPELCDEPFCQRTYDRAVRSHRGSDPVIRNETLEARSLSPEEKRARAQALAEARLAEFNEGIRQGMG